MEGCVFRNGLFQIENRAVCSRGQAWRRATGFAIVLASDVEGRRQITGQCLIPVVDTYSASLLVSPRVARGYI